MHLNWVLVASKIGAGSK